MDLEGIVLSEINQRKTNMWNLKKTKQMIKLNRNRVTDLENKQVI